jgi:hypothetical protein
MAHKLEIQPLATMEVIDAYDWYELQREGLGAEFLDELEAFIAAFFVIQPPTVSMIRLFGRAK